MATKSSNISLTHELKQFVNDRVRSGLYGNASDVHRAGLRALAREEMAASVKRFDEIMAGLPQEPITEKIEQEIVAAVRASRATEKRRARK
jgi:putative addiction module CopG family antidote